MGRLRTYLYEPTSADEASCLISNARHLRRSDNEFVRNNIYINADLTPAEAKASYELRSARSQRVSASHCRGKLSAVNSNPNPQQDGDAAQGLQ